MNGSLRRLLGLRTRSWCRHGTLVAEAFTLILKDLMSCKNRQCDIVLAFLAKLLHTINLALLCRFVGALR